MTSVPVAASVRPDRAVPGRSSRRTRRFNRASRKAVLNLLGVLVALFALFPVLWMVSTAFKPASEIFSLTPHPVPLHPTLANFRNVFSGSVIGISYWTFLKNSLFITIVAVAVSSLVGLLAAIALGRFKFRFRTTYLVMLLIVQLLPQQALVVSLFIDFRKLNLLDSLVGLIAVYTAFALPVTIWMLRNFAATVPRELEEAAAIDGAGAWTRFWRILLPMVSPGLVSTSVFAFIFAYNEFVFALTFLGTDTAKFTLPLYVQYFYGQNSTDWGAIMASSTLFTIPVLAFFLLTQRRLASGLVARRGEGMTALEPYEPSIDPAVAALADAILIPPFPGTIAPLWLLRALERGLAGVTFFGANVTGDTSALTAALRAAAPVEPVIAIDEEGGDVTRVAYASGSPYPGNAALGAVDDVSLTQAMYAAIGADLSRLGINTDLAPDADVLDLAGSSVVGTRSFGPDPALVARHVAAAVSGLQSSGVAACAKHFPGHGSAGDDSHLSLATVSGTLAEIRARDLPPFAAAIAAGSLAIMPGHLRVPELTGALPATLSPAAVTGLLRGELGFTGVVICDALEMKAASAVLGIPEAAVLAVIAGVDLLCLGRDTDEAMYHAVRAAIADAVASGRLAGARLEEAAARVASLRAGLALARDAQRSGTSGTGPGAASGPGVLAGPGVGAGDGIGLVAARRALRRSGPVPAALVDPLIVEVEPEENIAAGRFTWGFEPWAAVKRVDPAAGDGAAAGSILAASAGRPLVLAVRDARSVLSLVDQVLAARPDAVIVEMGVPAWTPPPGTAYLATYGASRVCARAAAEALGLA